MVVKLGVSVSERVRAMLMCVQAVLVQYIDAARVRRKMVGRGTLWNLRLLTTGVARGFGADDGCGVDVTSSIYTGRDRQCKIGEK